MAHPHWPLWDLRIRTPRLELRTLREQEMADLVEVIDGGLHDPATMPFLHPFTDVPPPQREREAYQHYWRSWATWTPEQWHLQFATYQDGRCVGTQSLEATRFPTLRTVRTGSFVGRADQGRGIGKEMRAAVLHLAFAGLGAARAETEAFDDNAASRPRHGVAGLPAQRRGVGDATGPTGPGAALRAGPGRLGATAPQ